MSDPRGEPYASYPALYTFLGGYLYQTWSQDYDGPEPVLAEFLADCDPPDLERFVAEANTLLAEDDERFLAIFGRLSANLDPRADYGWDEREWLTSLREAAAAELGRRGQASSE